MQVESRFMAASTELEPLRVEFAECRRVDEIRCANEVDQQNVVEKLTRENEALKKRLKMHNFGRVVGALIVLVAATLTT